MQNRFVIVVLAFVHLTECHIISNDKTKAYRRVKITLPTVKHSDEIGKFTQIFDALDFVHQQSRKFDHLNENIAKNVILFMGDGMGIPISTASRIHSNGEKGALSFEQFPFVGMSKTYCVDQMVADSACSATGNQSNCSNETVKEARFNCEIICFELRSRGVSLFVWREGEFGNSWS